MLAEHTRTDACQCGQRAAKYCRACDLAYCTACCAKRHARGAFMRHVIDDAVASRTAAPVSAECATATDRDAQHALGVCYECLLAPAALRCRACELDYCAACSAHVHSAGTMQSHNASSHFVDLQHAPSEPSLPHEPHGDQDDDSTACVREQLCDLTATTTSNSSNGSSRDAFGLKTAMIRGGEATGTVADPDQEAAPSSPALTIDDAVDVAESYDLWSSWNVRSFSEQATSIDSASQWRNLRSLAIDSKASTSAATLNATDLPLASLSQSLEALAFPSASAAVPQPPVAFVRRPRSYSDYTSLRSSGFVSQNLWTTTSTPTPASAVVAASISHATTVETASATLELASAMTTTFPSRHVLVQSATGAFDAADVQRLTDQLNRFGTVARLRDDLAADGLLFATYYELKRAIAAVQHWTSSPPTAAAAVTADASISTLTSLAQRRRSSDVAHFCLPFDPPVDSTSATLLVTLHGAPVTSTEMRAFCSRFGDVASVQQRDDASSEYVLELNDARDVDTVIDSLTSAIHPHGALTAARTHAPALDAAKLVLVQRHVERAASGSSPPLTPSLLDLSHNSDGLDAASAIEARGPSTAVASAAPSPPTVLATAQSCTSSPFESSISGMAFQTRTHSPALASNDPIWSPSPSATTLRPRSSSSSVIGVRSMFADSAPFANPYNGAAGLAAASASHSAASAAGADTFQPFQPSHVAHQQQLYHHQQQQRLMHPTGSRFSAPQRSDSDPSLRASHRHHQQAPVPTGRNDQGTGEFSLSLSRVVSGADARTTLMVRNIPNKYTQQMLLSEIDVHHRGRYDFFYLPIDFKNKCNMGYAFVNFVNAVDIVPFVYEFDNQRWRNFNSEKVCAISYARLQGKDAMIARFQHSSLLDKHESYRPLVFASDGPNRGSPEPFPVPKQPLPTHHSYSHNHNSHTSHKKHHVVMGGSSGAPNDFVASSAHAAASRLYVQSQQQMQQQMQMHQQQQMQALHFAQQQMQLMATGQFAHGGLHAQGATPHMGFQPHFQLLPQQQQHHLHSQLQPLAPRQMSAHAGSGIPAKTLFNHPQYPQHPQHPYPQHQQQQYQHQQYH